MKIAKQPHGMQQNESHIQPIEKQKHTVEETLEDREGNVAKRQGMNNKKTKNN